MTKPQLKEMIRLLGRTMRALPLNTPEDVQEHKMIQVKLNDLMEIYYKN